MRQVHVYLKEQDYQKFQALLGAQGETVSNWIRRQIKKHLNNEHAKTERKVIRVVAR